MHVEVAVVGRGMIGSAAGRHLAEAGVSTALIGPAEALDRHSSQGPFSSHADEGRITRIFGRTPVWTTVAARSIDRYADIEARSGIGFYSPSGVVAILDDVHQWIEHASGFELDARMVTEDWLRTNTGIEAPAGVEIAYESSPGGHINPRRLVAAQSKLTAMAGGEVVEHAATSIRRRAGGFTVGGAWGELEADRVLVATGAFGTDLIHAVLNVERRARTVLMIEVDGHESIPALISVTPDHRMDEIYWVPPVRYPDGRTCIKIGGHQKNPQVLADDELVDWFHTDGSEEEVSALEASFRSLLPSAQILSITQSPCVITETPTSHPYIGWVEDGLAVAIGGSGSAAKSSDELGRLASTLFGDDGWIDDLDPQVFAPQFV